MRKRSVVMCLIAIIAVPVLILLSGGMSHSQAQEKKGAPKASCVTDQCHTKVNKVKFVHGPVAAGECATCHGASEKHATNPKRYKFKKIEDLSKKCYDCHDKFKPKKFVHAPVKDGECAACHNPHGSNYKFQLLSKGGEMCFTCHDDAIVGGKFVHGPAAVGGCVACHEPHSSDYAKSLRTKGAELCYTCHIDKAEDIHKAAFVHAPVSDNCTGCHNPHSAPKEFFLQASAPALCLNCH